MSNDPRPAKPPLPLLKRPASGTMPATRGAPREPERAAKASETSRSGTIAAVRPGEVAAVPRPTNVLRRLDPSFTSEDNSVSWEPRGTLVGSSYRDSMPTIPSPEALEAQLLAKLAEPSQRPPASPAAVMPAPLKPGARAQFEPPHAPAVSASPIIELEKAAAVIVDPFALTGAPLPDHGTPTTGHSVSVTVDVTSQLWEPETAAEQLAVETPADVAHDLPDSDHGEIAPKPCERSRITVPPARRRRRRWRAVRAMFLGALVLGGVAAAGWYRYPAAFERGWQRAQTELPDWRGALEHYWARGLDAIGR